MIDIKKWLEKWILSGGDSSGTTANEDGAIAERLEQVQEATNRGTGTSLPANKSLYDIIGTTYVDGGGAFNVDSVWDDLRTLAQYIIDGTAGAEAGTALPAGKSLRNLLGTEYVDAGGNPDVDTIRDHLTAFIGKGTGTQLGANKSLIDTMMLDIMLDHLQGVACADITDPVDMTAEVVDNSVISNILTVEGDTSDYDRRTDSLEAISESVAGGFADQLVLHEVYITGDMRNTVITTIFSLDAMAGTCKDIKIKVAFDGATAANITPILWVSDPDDTATLDQVYPDLTAGQTHAGARTEYYDLGDLGEGCQMELRYTSAGDDSGIDYDSVLTYMQ